MCPYRNRERGRRDSPLCFTSVEAEKKDLKFGVAWVSFFLGCVSLRGISRQACAPLLRPFVTPCHFPSQFPRFTKISLQFNLCNLISTAVGTPIPSETEQTTTNRRANCIFRFVLSTNIFYIVKLGPLSSCCACNTLKLTQDQDKK